MKYISLFILLIIFFDSSYARYSDYHDDYYYESYDDYGNENDYEPWDYNYHYEDYDYKPINYKNGDTCFFSSSNKKLIFGCYFNGYCYENPINSICVNDKYNAWKCISGYREINGSCSNDCIIKGNIGFESKEKIYHLPSCSDYENTVINEAYGEKRFCSEKDAIDSGWRKSKNCPLPKVVYNNSSTSLNTSSKNKDDYYWIFWLIFILGGIIIYNKNT